MTPSPSALISLALVIVLAPAVAGLATRTRSWLTGRRGAPVLQLYADIWKLTRRGAVYSAATTGALQLAPVVVAVTTLAAATLVPLDGNASAFRFAGDAVAFAGVIALGRFVIVLGALDTGSSFEGMGASREVTIATFVEGGLFLVFAVTATLGGDGSLTAMFGGSLAGHWGDAAPSLVMAGAGLFALLLAECGRVPVDDPSTHLELTMIHEVIVLDYSGPDLALLTWAASLKLSLFGALAAALLVPRGALGSVGAVVALVASLAATGVVVGVVESATARLRMPRVPLFLAGSASLALIGLVLLLR